MLLIRVGVDASTCVINSHLVRDFEQFTDSEKLRDLL